MVYKARCGPSHWLDQRPPRPPQWGSRNPPGSLRGGRLAGLCPGMGAAWDGVGTGEHRDEELGAAAMCPAYPTF